MLCTCLSEESEKRHADLKRMRKMTVKRMRNLSKQQNLNIEGIQDYIHYILYTDKPYFKLEIHL